MRERIPLPHTDLLGRWQELKLTPQSRVYPDFSLFPFRIAFCGKIYNGVTCVEINRRVFPHHSTFTYWYDYIALRQYLTKYRLGKRENWNSDRWGDWYGRRMKYSDFLIPPIVINSFRDLCIEHQVSILVAKPFHQEETRRLVLNRRLKSLDFFRILNPYQAFQELSMWIGGLPQPDKAMLRISDKDKIHKRGFDKWSFRRQPKD